MNTVNRSVRSSNGMTMVRRTKLGFPVTGCRFGTNGGSYSYEHSHREADALEFGTQKSMYGTYYIVEHKDVTVAFHWGFDTINMHCVHLGHNFLDHTSNPDSFDQLTIQNGASTFGLTIPSLFADRWVVVNTILVMLARGCWYSLCWV
jgi:hypothetical protein